MFKLLKKRVLRLLFWRVSFWKLSVLLLFTLSMLGISFRVIAGDSEDSPCGVIEDYLGDVQILDHARANLLEVKIHGGVACGSSITVGKGWARIRHQNGTRFNLSSETFIQFPDWREEAFFKDDNLILYKGQVFVESDVETEEFKIVSATGRARLGRGKAIFIFRPEDEISQLIALKNFGTLENRFEQDKKVRVDAGEFTELNFKVLRVIPSLPAPISVATLRPKLADLQIPEKEAWNEIQTVMRKQKKVTQKVQSKAKSQCKPSVSREKDGKFHYFRNGVRQMDPSLKGHWIEKAVGDQSVGESVLYPDKFYGKPRHVDVKVENIEEIEKLNEHDAFEKKKLLEDLSRIQSD